MIVLKQKIEGEGVNRMAWWEPSKEGYMVVGVCDNCLVKRFLEIKKGKHLSEITDKIECPNCGCKELRATTVDYNWYAPVFMFDAVDKSRTIFIKQDLFQMQQDFKKMKL